MREPINRRAPSIPASAMPRRATADPPSGIAAAVVPAENANLVDLKVPRLGSFAVNIQVPAVPVPKAPPLIVPVPVTDTVPAPWLKIEDEIKSKVKPPTLQKLAIGPETNDHGAANVAKVPAATEEKSPVAPATCGLFAAENAQYQAVTFVAVSTVAVSILALPTNEILPDAA